MPQSALVEKLVSYARENPMATDTAAGIAEWWVKMPLKEVLPVLESLVEGGMWQKVKFDDRVLYCPIQDTGSTFHKGKEASFYPRERTHQNKEGSG